MNSEFLITAFIVVLAPGTGVLYTISTALTHSHRASWAASVGCTLGILPHLLATIFGLAALLHTSAIIFQWFKWVGVLYLLYLAWMTLKEGAQPQAQQQYLKSHSYFKIAIRGFLINILNPKLSLFFLAFLPQFIVPDQGDVFLQMVGMGAVFMVMTLVVFVLYGFFAATVRNQLDDRSTWMIWFNRITAGAFVSLGVRLGFLEK
ncbi:MAG: LysE family translocator [Magnetococcales bacterium]|nr:LysE family translocator [Magnetococcales bacterium]